MNADVDVDPTDGRDETADERHDRNWNELLQELRVTQTGTQIITGFLLTLPFQQRFTVLDAFELDVYLVLVVLAAISTVIGLAPVTLHRLLFRQRAKEEMVKVGNRILLTAIVVVGLVVSGVVLLIFDVVVSRQAGIIGGIIAIVLIAAVWLAIPTASRKDRN
ncbi:DUF6328 family protein [soil metagenome]